MRGNSRTRRRGDNGMIANWGRRRVIRFASAHNFTIAVKHGSGHAHDAQQRGDDLGGRVEAIYATAEPTPSDRELHSRNENAYDSRVRECADDLPGVVVVIPAVRQSTIVSLVGATHLLDRLLPGGPGTSKPPSRLSPILHAETGLSHDDLRTYEDHAEIQDHMEGHGCLMV